MDNQHGNVLHVMDKYFEVMAYSIGAMTGDGSVKKYLRKSEEGRMFTVYNASISSMDEECVGKVCYEVDVLFHKNFKPTPYVSPKGTKMYRIGFGSEETFNFFNYFIREKLTVPDEVFRVSRKAKTDYIAGLFDTDGWITSHNGYYRLGFASRHRTFVEDVARLLMKTGVKVGKINEDVSGYGTLMFRITPNLRSFIEKGYYFHIQRKAKRVEEYIYSMKLSHKMVRPSETIMSNP